MRLLAYLVVALLSLGLPGDLRPSQGRFGHYDLLLHVEPEEGLISVDVAITLPPVRAGEEVELILGRSYTVTDIEAPSGASAAIGATEQPFAGLQRVAIRFASAADAPQVRLRYGGPLSPSGTPPMNLVTPQLVELNIDSMWLPEAFGTHTKA